MRIITKRTIADFIEKHSDSQESLNKWFLKTKSAEWTSLKDIKDSFNSADYVKNDLYVFNISGNKYRLIARIFFRSRLVYIRFIGTHREYDRVDMDTL